jgi:hypothetical protein
MAVKKTATKSVKGKSASAKKEAPIKASVKPKAKKREGVDHVHIIERDFIIITSSGFLVIVLALLLFFN